MSNVYLLIIILIIAIPTFIGFKRIISSFSSKNKSCGCSSSKKVKHEDGSCGCGCHKD